MWDSLGSLAALATIGLAAWSLGRPFVRRLRLDAPDDASRSPDSLAILVWSIVLGLVVWGTALAIMGLAGLLYRPAIGFLTLAACFHGLGRLIHAANQSAERAGVREPRRKSPLSLDLPLPPEIVSPPRWLLRGAVVAATAACLAALVAGLAPPTAGDALCYHLELPKVFLDRHAIEHLPYHDNSTFPLLVEMWFLWGLAIEGPIAAQLIHWGAGVLFVLATFLLASPIVGRGWAWIAASVVALVPAVTNQMTAPLNDLAMALLTTMTLIAWRRAAEERALGWATAAGLCLGGALATKYTAALFVVAGGSACGWQVWRSTDARRRLAPAAAVFALTALVVCGVWYGRSAWHRGDPVYPFLSQSNPDAPAAFPESKRRLGLEPGDLVAAPWSLTMHPERFGGRGAQFGALFLAALPGLIFVRRPPGLGPLLVIAAIYAAGWYVLRQNLRFLLPVVPLLSIAAVHALRGTEWFPQWPRRVVTAGLVALALWGLVIPVARARHYAAVAIGLESREHYLERREPTWPAAQVVNGLLPAETRLLSQDYRAFYFERPITRENVYRRVERYDRDLSASRALETRLRRDGFTHVLLAEAIGPGINYEGTLSRLVEDAMNPPPRPADAAATANPWRCLLDYRFADADGAVRRYRLVEIP